MLRLRRDADALLRAAAPPLIIYFVTLMPRRFR